MQISLKQYIDYNNQIGDGSYSKVYAMKQGSNYTKYVAKVIKSHIYADKKTRIHVDRQIQCLNELKQISEVLKILKVEDQIIFLEKCYTSLDKLIKKNRLSEYDILLLIKSLLKCLSDMNDKKYLHRDIKPANILIKEQKKAIIRLSDFNCSKKFSDPNDCTEQHTEKIGTFMYSAPEVRLTKYYNLKCDVYSFGLVLYELIFGKLPFESSMLSILKFETYLKQNKLKITQTNNIQPYFIELIQNTVVFNSHERPNFQELWMNFQLKFIQLQDKLKTKCPNRLFHSPIKIKSINSSDGNIHWYGRTAFSSNYATLLNLINIIKNQVLKYYPYLQIQKTMNYFKQQIEWVQLRYLLEMILLNMFIQQVSVEINKLKKYKIENYNINNLKLSVEQMNDYNKLIESYESEFEYEKTKINQKINYRKNNVQKLKVKQYHKIYNVITQFIIEQDYNDIYKFFLKEFRKNFFNIDKKKYAFSFLLLLIPLDIQEISYNNIMNEIKKNSKQTINQQIYTQERVSECQKKWKKYFG